MVISFFVVVFLSHFSLRPAAESWHGRLYVLLSFLIYLFLTIPLGPITCISKCTGPIFAEFSE